MILVPQAVALRIYPSHFSIKEHHSLCQGVLSIYPSKELNPDSHSPQDGFRTASTPWRPYSSVSADYSRVSLPIPTPQLSSLLTQCKNYSIDPPRELDSSALRRPISRAQYVCSPNLLSHLTLRHSIPKSAQSLFRASSICHILSTDAHSYEIVGWGAPGSGGGRGAEPAFGASSTDGTSAKSKMINLISSVRTLMRSMFRSFSFLPITKLDCGESLIT